MARNGSEGQISPTRVNTAEKRLRMRQHYWNLYCERDASNTAEKRLRMRQPYL
jgi:hypothetical protein